MLPVAIAVVILVSMVVTAYFAIRVERLLNAALCLAATSAILSLLLYAMGAYQVAVIELSVGAGLVTILFVFAISLADESSFPDGARALRSVLRPILPSWLSIGLVIAALVVLVRLLGAWLWAPMPEPLTPSVDASAIFSQMAWETRAFDLIGQLALIFGGVLGLVSLLAEALPDEDATTMRLETDPETNILVQPLVEAFPEPIVAIPEGEPQ